MNKDVDDRAPFARAMDWVTRIMTASFSMVIPAIAGHFLDRWLGTKILFTILGLAFGMASGFWLLLKIVRESEKTPSENE